MVADSCYQGNTELRGPVEVYISHAQIVFSFAKAVADGVFRHLPLHPVGYTQRYGQTPAVARHFLVRRLTCAQCCNAESEILLKPDIRYDVALSEQPNKRETSPTMKEFGLTLEISILFN